VTTEGRIIVFVEMECFLVLLACLIILDVLQTSVIRCLIGRLLRIGGNNCLIFSEIDVGPALVGESRRLFQPLARRLLLLLPLNVFLKN
jgi:hypothetical protein